MSGDEAGGAAPTPEIPRLNHVALSVPPALLEGEARADLLRFYGEVFGWQEMPAPEGEAAQLVFRLHSNEQFVFLIAAAEPLRCPPTDHFGISVSSPDAIDSLLERARAFAATDDRVEISERRVDDFQAVKLHGVYVRYLLPLSIEIQHFEWAPGLGPSSGMDW